MDKHEKQVIRKIRRYLGYKYPKPYSFWFVYDDKDKAISWEGGFELPDYIKFRNQYTITSDGRIVRNWNYYKEDQEERQ